MQNIMELKGVSYYWKNPQKYGYGPQVGLIAQNIEEVYPEVVMTDAKTGLKSVAYGHLIAPVIEAIKSLYQKILGLEHHQDQQDRKIASIESSANSNQVEVEQLKAKVHQLEEENAQFKVRLERLEKKLSNTNSIK